MWEKTGRFFDPAEYGQTHAQMPTPLLLDRERMRVYYSTRDEANRSYGTYMDVHPGNMELLKVHTEPVIERGKVGAFDDSGAMPSCAVWDDGCYRLFYVGWNRCLEVYRLAIGVASSLNLDNLFIKVFDGPILDRSIDDPYWVSSPCVIKAGTKWTMWYVSCTGWKWDSGIAEPGYVIHRATSDNGIYWKFDGFCLRDRYAVARPCVIHHGGIYKMWYSHRGLTGYRDSPSESYRIGFAMSSDGRGWTRGTAGIDVSPDGWDSQMICYPYVYEYDGALHMLYSGNGFGKEGMGHAIWT